MSAISRHHTWSFGDFGHRQQQFIAVLGTLLFHFVIIGGLWLSDQLNNKVVREFRTEQVITATLMSLEQKVPKRELADVTNLAEQRKRRQQELRAERLKAEQEKIRLKKLAEAKALKKKKEQEKRVQEERKREEQRKQQLEQQRLQQIENQRLESLNLEEQLFDSALDDDLLEQQQVEAEQLAQQRTAGYQQYIYQQIRQQWIRPHSARNGMETLLKVNMVPTGYVNTVSIARSSGDDGFDRSAVQAVKKASPFTVLTQLSTAEFDRHFRNFNILFNPQDLRQ